MGAAKDFNVYNKISRGEHICNGDKLYSREEMKKMLAESGLKLEEIMMLYDLNAEAAFDEVSRMAGSEFCEVADDEKIDLARIGDWTLDTFIEHEENKACFRILMIVQALAACVAILGSLFMDGDSVRLWGVLTAAIIFLSYLIAWSVFSIIKYCRPNLFTELGIKDTLGPEHYCRKKVQKTLTNRQKVLNSVSNTLHMYEAMEDYISRRSKKKVLFDAQPTEDDLK